MAALGALAHAIPRFQTGSDQVDEAAARVLALSRPDLRVLDHLREGPQTIAVLEDRLGVTARELASVLERLQLFGYARLVTDDAGQLERLDMTPHAKAWTESLYGPIRDEGFALMDAYDTPTLEVMARFLETACALQERHTERLRRLTTEFAPLPGKRRPSRPRGTLSTAALRRVQLLVEAHLDRPLQVADLARRAGLSPFHFSRAFKASTGLTPHAYLQGQRVARAVTLVRDTNTPLSQVALDCGFSTQSRMTTAFARSMGLTPARYRRAHGKTAGSGQTRHRAER
jgi:AraC family transcriptional regulator